MDDRFRLFSVDDHIIEPANLWTSRLPTAYHDRCPHVVENGGHEMWEYEGGQGATIGLNAVIGKPPQEWGADPISFADMRAGCFDPVQRAADMADDGIIGSVPFPSVPGFGGRVFNEFKDKELADLCVRAYNDFVLDEWCPAAPDLYVPTVICQLWEPRLAAAEIRRSAERGARALSFPENTYPLGLPALQNPHWDPVWEALEETGTVVSMHGGSSGSIPMASPEAHFSTAIIGAPGQVGIQTITDLLFSPLIRRFDLQFVVTETGAGYVPYLLERADFVWERHKYWAGFDDLRPSDLFRDHIYVCLVNETFAVKVRHDIGIRNILWECDYPHAETTWPNSQACAEKAFAGVPRDEVDLMTHGNAQRIFRFPDGGGTARD